MIISLPSSRKQRARSSTSHVTIVTERMLRANVVAPTQAAASKLLKSKCGPFTMIQVIVGYIGDNFFMYFNGTIERGD